MKTIHKYKLEPTDFQNVNLPKGSQILSVGSQPASVGSRLAEQLVMWVMVDPNETTQEGVMIRIFGTGHMIHSEHTMRFLGTVQMLNYSLVWHVFEERI